MRVFCGALVIMMTCLGLAGCGIPMAKTLTKVSNVSAIGMSFLPELPNFGTPTSREVPNVISPVHEEAYDDKLDLNSIISINPNALTVKNRSS